MSEHVREESGRRPVCGEHLRPLSTLSCLALLLDDSDVYCALPPLRAG